MTDERFKKELLNLTRQNNPNDFLMTVPEAAKRLCIGEQALRELIDDGEIFAMEIKGKKISNFEINRFIEEYRNRNFSEV